MSMITAKLGDICTIYTGTGFPVQYQGESSGDYPFFKVGDISKNVSKGHIYLTDCDNYISKEVAKKIKGTIVPVNTVVFAKIGEAVKLNRRAITSANCLVDNNAMGICPDQTKILLPYFYHYMCSVKLEKFAEATTVPSVKKGVVEQLEIPLPSIDEQRVISDTLDNIDDLVLLRKQQLSQLEELVKSRFIELFGSIPDSEHTTMTDVCSIITDGTHQPPKFTSSGIPFLFVSNIVTNKITYKTEKHISEETYAELIKRTPIEIGDILLSTVGSYGHPAVVETDERFCFQRHIAYLKPKNDVVNSRYLYGVLLSADVQKQIDEKVKGIAQKTLNLSEIKKLHFPLPPMELQNEFAAFVEHTDKLKFTVRNTITIYTALILYFTNFHWERRASVSNKGVKP